MQALPSSLIDRLSEAAPDLRGRLLEKVPLKDVTWLRVGGAAEALFSPADESDLGYFLHSCPQDVPLTVIGTGSNLLVRDGGVPGVVIRLARGLNETQVSADNTITAGAAVPDVRLAQVASVACIGGLAFLRGIPGTVGGALRMNAGAHGGETGDILVSARAIDRRGQLHVFDNASMGFTYRQSVVSQDFIFLEATFRGTLRKREDIEREMQAVAEYREANQPIKSRTGGSTFKNPPGHSAWKLIDAAGCRGLRVGGVHMSEMHCNFLINDRDATATDIETLVETARQRVFDHSGIMLEWEIKRIGVPLPDAEMPVTAVER